MERPELLDQSMKDVLSLPDVSDVFEGAHTSQGDESPVSAMAADKLMLDPAPNFGCSKEALIMLS